MKKRNRVIALAAAGVLTLASSSLHADVVSWIFNSADDFGNTNDWFDPTTSTHRLPGINDVADFNIQPGGQWVGPQLFSGDRTSGGIIVNNFDVRIHLGGHTWTLPGFNADPDSIIVGQNTGDHGSLQFYDNTFFNGHVDSGSRIILGNSTASFGTLDVGGGANLTVDNDNVYAGLFGAGTLIVNPGTMYVGDELLFGYFASGAGSCQLVGNLSVDSATHIGLNGAGSFTQTDGMFTSPSVTLGTNVGATGFLEVDGGTFLVNHSVIFKNNGSGPVASGANVLFNVGNAGQGVVNQTGGLVEVTTNQGVGDMAIGSYSGSGNGTYNLSTSSGVATLSVQGSLLIGNQFGTRGTLTQSGGLGFPSTLSVGGGIHLGFDGSGTESMGAFSNLICTGSMNVGEGGVGYFRQLGGSATLGNGAETLYVGAVGFGTFIQSGGVFTTANEQIGVFGAGTFIQSGVSTTNRLNNVLLLANHAGSSGYYSLSDGTLQVAAQIDCGMGSAGTLLINSGTASVGTDLNVYSTGTVLWNGGTLLIPGKLSVTGGHFLENANGSRLLRVGTLSVTSNGVVDLNDNDMQILGGNNSGSVSSLVVSGRNGGSWDGPGLRASAALTLPRIRTLGVFTGQEFKTARGVSTLFDGQAVSNTDVLVKFTYFGDDNLNGKVDGGDYTRMDLTFGMEATLGNIGGWVNGDFDYSGRVDGSDYALADLAFTGQSGTLARALAFLDGSDPDRNSMSGPALGMVMQHFDEFGDAYASTFIEAVPEPSCVAALGLSIAGVLLKRRRVEH